MPIWHFRERHSLFVDASNDVVMKAVREAIWQEAPIARFFLQPTQNKISPERRIMDDFAGEGAQILEVNDNEALYGGISDDTPIKLDRPMAEVFREFNEPGYKKVGFNVLYANGTLSTETRILATDEKSRKEFARYWTVIRIPSGMIRMSLLRAIRRRVREMTKAS